MQRRRPEEWETITKAQEASGLPVRQFCRREGICERSFRTYRQKAHIVAVHATDRGLPGFVELQQKSETVFRTKTSVMIPESLESITIRFGNGISIDVRASADRETVQWICGMIRDIA